MTVNNPQKEIFVPTNRHRHIYNNRTGDNYAKAQDKKGSKETNNSNQKRQGQGDEGVSRTPFEL